ncbi:hypothetical protein [Paenibacillus sp.]
MIEKGRLTVRQLASLMFLCTIGESIGKSAEIFLPLIVLFLLILTVCLIPMYI